MIVLSRTRRIDWPRIMQNLSALGMTRAEIAEHVQVSESLVKNYASQDQVTEPAFWTGSAILVLWCEKTGLRWPDAPTRHVAPSVSEVLRQNA